MKQVTHHSIFRSILAVSLDFLALGISLVIGYGLWVLFPWHGNFQSFSDYSLILWILPALGVFIFKIIGLYQSEVGILGVEEQARIFKGIWIVYTVALALSFFYRQIHFSRLSVFYSIFIAIFLVSLERFLVRHFFEKLNQKGIGVRQAVIYGAGYHGQRLERRIRQSPKLGIQIAGYLDDDPDRLQKKPEKEYLLGGLGALKKLAPEKNIGILFIAHRKLEEEKVMEIFHLCRQMKVQCWAIPSLYQFHIERAELTHIGGIPLVGFRYSFEQRPYAAIKAILDALVCALLGMIALPLTLAIALGSKMTSRGPLFFKQARVGQKGKKFTIWKFRTLRAQAARADEISPELRDAEVSLPPFGRFLRHTGLDELPQLWNVLRGEMSLVGPRPEMPFIVEKYGPLEDERLTVKPGITGLWQISQDRKKKPIHENMDYDLYYVEHLGFNLDLAILLKTLVIVIWRVAEGLRLRKQFRS